MRADFRQVFPPAWFLFLALLALLPAGCPSGVFAMVHGEKFDARVGARAAIIHASRVVLTPEHSGANAPERLTGTAAATPDMPEREVR